MSKIKTAATLFSGLGLADIGLKLAGLDVVLAVEIFPAIAEWYQRNHPTCQTMVGSVEEFDYRQFSGVDLLHMSPPCQQYSIARNKSLPRHQGADASLLTFKAIEQIRPKFITLENVRGYALSKSYSQLKQFLWDLGYWVNEEIIDCADYGVPQSRVRFIVRWISDAVLADYPVIRYQTLFGEKYWDGLRLQRQERKGWYSAIADLLPSLPETELAPWQINRLPAEFQSHLLIGDQNGMIRASDRPAFTVCVKGPPRVLLMRRVGQRSGPGSLDIFPAEMPSPTIRALQDSHWRQLDGWDGRKVVEITIQCLGRFQTLPDSFILPERKSLASIGIGNGVPCEMMRQIASTLISPANSMDMTTPVITNSMDMTTPVITKDQPKWTTDDWRTPDEERQPVVTLVRQALGGAIGLDPTADNGRRIPAQRHITKTDDCLQLDWESPAGTVFLNPPYSNPLPFLEKLIEQIDQGHVREAIVILPLRCIGNQGTGKIIEERAKAQCVWKRNGRLAFLAEDGTPRKKPDFISCLIYFGDMEHRFAETFQEYGVVSYFEKKPIFIPLKTEYYQAFKDGSKRIEYRKAGTGQFTLAGCFPGRRVTLSRGYSAHDRIKGTVVKSWVEHHESPSGAIAACYGTEPIDIIAISIAVNSETQCGKSAVVTGTEEVRSPLQKSELHKKGLCDYVINVASGCLHSCTFCYVPSTPVIRFRQNHLQDLGVENPQQDWGKYLFTRDAIAQQLEEVLASKRTWQETPAGKGVVMLCSGTDPYQNQRTAAITRACVEVLLKYGKRVRILTRSPLWIQDLDILVNPLVTVGMSLPHLDDRLSRQIEPNAPLPSDRYRALQKGAAAGCRLFIAMAPTPPQMVVPDFLRHLSELKKLNPEVIFWEPINARGTNGARMLDAGLDFVQDISKTQTWADNFVRQWRELNVASSLTSCQKLLHIWPDRALKGYLPDNELESWWSRPTEEHWPSPSSPTQPKTTIMFTEEEYYKLGENIGDFNRETSCLEISPIAYLPEAPDTLTVSLSIDARIAALTEEVESLEEQARIRREEITQLQEQAKTNLKSELEGKLEEIRELFERASQYDITDDFCIKLRSFHDEVCPGSCKDADETDEATVPEEPVDGVFIDFRGTITKSPSLPNYTEQDGEVSSEKEKKSYVDSNPHEENVQPSEDSRSNRFCHAILKFPTAPVAEDWKDWFMNLINIGNILGKDVKVFRNKRSRNIQFENLTLDELAILNNLELPESIPTPLAAQEMWATAAAIATATSTATTS